MPFDREAEVQKYILSYSKPNYRMSGARMDWAVTDLADLSTRGSLLDVGCGRGEMLNQAENLGFDPVHGLEAVPDLCSDARVTEGRATDLPFADDSYDVVTLWDVIEHLPPGDDEIVCREMRRVARKHVLLTANNRTSQKHIGVELHINRRPYKEWDDLLRSWFAGATVTWLHPSQGAVSETWRIDL